MSRTTESYLTCDYCGERFMLGYGDLDPISLPEGWKLTDTFDTHACPDCPEKGDALYAGVSG